MNCITEVCKKSTNTSTNTSNVHKKKLHASHWLKTSVFSCKGDVCDVFKSTLLMSDNMISLAILCNEHF